MTLFRQIFPFVRWLRTYQKWIFSRSRLPLPVSGDACLRSREKESGRPRQMAIASIRGIRVWTTFWWGFANLRIFIWHPFAQLLKISKLNFSASLTESCLDVIGVMDSVNLFRPNIIQTICNRLFNFKSAFWNQEIVIR